MGPCNDLEGEQPEAFQKLMLTFFATGKAEATAFTREPMAFHVKWGLPTLAKLALGSGLFLILALGVLAGLLLRFLRRKRAARVKA